MNNNLNVQEGDFLKILNLIDRFQVGNFINIIGTYKGIIIYT